MRWPVGRATVKSGSAGRERQWQEQLIGEVKLNRSLRGMMCAESSDRFVGHSLGRLS